MWTNFENLTITLDLDKIKKFQCGIAEDQWISPDVTFKYLNFRGKFARLGS